MRKKLRDWVSRKDPAFFLMILSMFTAFFIELLNRWSLYDTGIFTFGSMGLFLYNSFIILLTLIPSLLLKRRYFYLTIVEMLWLILGIANRIVRTFRSSPISYPDFLVIGEGIKIANKYLNVFTIIAIVLAIIAIIAFVVWVYRTIVPLKKRQITIKNVGRIIVLVLLVVVTTLSGLKTGHLSIKFTNITEAYEEYGFAYCFLTSVISRGISQPDEYSTKKVDEVMSEIETKTPKKEQKKQEKTTKATKENPNIIFLQLESFFDVSYINDIKLKQNPTPFFSYLKENYTTGLLTVPVVGAGTVNTEFEVQTGMNLEDFGIGEYPYKTVLLDKTCESIAYLLGNRDYKTHAIHNNTATFYSRNKVFSNLGYDDFTTIETMPKTAKNSLGWAKDEVLTSQVLEALKSTKERDFIYTITVQSHGKYSDAEIEEGDKEIIDVYDSDGKEVSDSFKYYLTQIQDVDEFIESLIIALDHYDEPTIVVMYGDHLPSLDLTADDLKNGSLYQTEYVIWDNIGLKKQDKDLHSYQLSASVLQKINNSDGTIMKYHQQRSEEGGYLSGLKLLEYDMLYGDQESYQYAEKTWEPTDLKYGVDKPKVESVRQLGKLLHIHGSNFNEYSRIYINGEEFETHYNTETFLSTVLKEELKPGDEIVISQVDSEGDVLSSSEPWVMK